MLINVHIIVPMGLPGSGKTHYGNERYLNNYHCINIDFDAQMHNRREISEICEERLHVFFNGNFSHFVTDLDIYLDGLWLTNDSVKNLLGHVIPAINAAEYHAAYKYAKSDWTFRVEDIEIIHFDENRHFCLNNDRFRREKSSGITIKNAPFDNDMPKEFIEQIKSEYNVKDIIFIHRDIYKATLWDIVFADADLKSDKWVLAGRWGNYDGQTGDLIPENPLAFNVFDDFIMKLCPDISDVDYALLFNECCHVKKGHEDDYYGAWKDYAYWKCDKKKLYTMMLDMKLITEYAN